MGWNPFKDIQHFMEKIPGSPEAVMGSLNRGFKGELSWNPFEQGDRSVWDYGAGGSVNSKDPKHRMVGRAIGSYFGGQALGSYFGGAGSGAAYGGGTAAENAAAWSGAGAGGVGASGGVVGGELAYGGGTAAENAAAWQGSGAGGVDASGSVVGGNSLDGWLDMNGMGPNTWTAEGQGGFGGGGVGSTGGGSYYDQMLDYLKRKGGGVVDWYGKAKGSDLARIGVGLYGLNNARRAQNMMKMPGPGEMQNMPGYQAGLQAVQASAAQQGYTGGSNAAAAIGKYGADFYNQHLNQRMNSGMAQMQGNNQMLSNMALITRGFGW